MDLGTHMAGNQADNAFCLGGFEPSPRLDAAFAKTVETQHAVGVDHDLDDERIGERSGDCRSHGGLQHRTAAASRLGFEGAAHDGSPSFAGVSIDRPVASCRPT